MSGISKRYPGVLALEKVDFTVNAGEVHCLVGENGAGKSTLIKILSGALSPSEGSIQIDNQPVQLPSPHSALRLGISVIYQDFKLVPELSVAENIVLGHEPRGLLFIDRRKVHEIARAALLQLGEEIDTSAIVGTLSIAQRQIVEIAKALSRNVRILALDEPTASLTEREIENLFRVIRRLKSEGVGIIYISHRLEEVFDIGDRVTVLRDGKVVTSCPLPQVDRRKLIQWMVGREIEDEYPKIELQRGREILRIEHLSAAGLHDIDLTLYKGEILGIAGLVGSGRSELARVLFGADPKNEGRIFLDGKEMHPRSPHEAINEGIGLLTEDRNTLGLIMQMSVKENITISSMKSLGSLFIDEAKEQTTAMQYAKDLNIRPSTVDTEVENLSGGNRQKVVLARLLNTHAKVLIFDEPTAGIDVGAKHEIYTILNRLAEQGIGVVVISSDLPEVLGICDRIAVMCEGRIIEVLDRENATQEKIMLLATGNE